jgi:signal peptidase II
MLKIWIKSTRELGHSTRVFGEWFYLHYIENPGMAFGLEFGGDWGKIALSVFRIVAAGVIFWYLLKLIREQSPKLFIISVALIFAGAVGNIIDSAFYGLIFDRGSVWNGHYYEGYSGIARFCSPPDGYTGFLTGNVVDMLYFPLIESYYPEWFPFGLGGQKFIFFRPVFNIADAAISIGLGLIVLFQRRFFGHRNAVELVEPSSEQG